jgi:SRSO17 transposase
MAMAADAVRDLDEWLKPFLEVVGRKTRRTWAPLYVRGLLGPGERKSLQPMAVQLGLGGHDQLQHFLASPAWNDGPLWTVLAREADRMIGGADAVLVMDDTALPKKGTLSVGVARQYCGQLGKRANCQALVSLTLAGREVPIPLGLRLFLPQEWTDDLPRCAAAGVPDDAVIAAARARLRSPRWIAYGRPGCGSAWCWPTLAMARAPPSAIASMRVVCAGRWASRALRRSTIETSG